MADSIFRKKSLEKLSSPESLNEYIKVANPSVWAFLAGVVVLLIGVLFWGIFGHIVSDITVVISSDGESTVCYVPEDNIKSFESVTEITVDGTTIKTGQIPSEPTKLTEENDPYLLHVMNAEDSVWVYEVPLNGSLPEGTYTARVEVGRVAPSTYITN